MTPEEQFADTLLRASQGVFVCFLFVIGVLILNALRIDPDDGTDGD